jgi:hypothetical protein
MKLADELERRGILTRLVRRDLPITAHHGHAVAMDTAKGSIRQRGSSSYELRVYWGTDPSTGRRRWLTRTVHGDRADACRELKAFAAHAKCRSRCGCTHHGGGASGFVVRSEPPGLVANLRNLQSIVERHLKNLRSQRTLPRRRIRCCAITAQRPCAMGNSPGQPGHHRASDRQ